MTMAGGIPGVPTNFWQVWEGQGWVGGCRGGGSWARGTGRGGPGSQGRANARLTPGRGPCSGQSGALRGVCSSKRVCVCVCTYTCVHECMHATAHGLWAAQSGKALTRASAYSTHACVSTRVLLWPTRRRRPGPGARGRPRGLRGQGMGRVHGCARAGTPACRNMGMCHKGGQGVKGHTITLRGQ